ncbi:acetyl-CoA carboxylase biotin carboxyl carrier protein [Companilactobacillus sp.]|jgi:acetyl-CoA carboxylase biotin carboxyl carrier protein|uniref:acetyl-CoA carboxylase biotin carboxyl carrier protein n=1 Tax=Companilactobacillus sp. TaxID=2767905 RepID=UPI0025C0988D|nr:biotin/lipoyl-containing protein [Companilactobacillus sp.]MCH4009619.1 acetyl-CoA carboxylase biotin carboxyl carrier protein subunit [Companilactobacillus sp.]MCH4052705.1 acetyl-CoA carboxylase biotin carboxyl carrier protein subunit [Companilactobacillus sp.]MCH4077561.1 acetyl-CoA carboxylase biotin carboxyl carrier protein subunit [Companilactobacillus sp.]MCH4126137.1 acetyl-CoA carboxylase biotin carboxyl carrier protein subunit [Companilactobacillus sp.]MCI1311845.1 acetyl-CoA carb
MELDRVKELIKLLNESELSHLEIDDKQGHIILEKNLTVAASEPAPVAETQVKSTDDAKVIKAPFVGTFYTSEQPDKAPLIQPGDTVKKGQAVGIIEAMKMMNEVKSDVDGVIDKILVTNGDAVEYDQPLFTLKD